MLPHTVDCLSEVFLQARLFRSQQPGVATRTNTRVQSYFPSALELTTKQFGESNPRTAKVDDIRKTVRWVAERAGRGECGGVERRSQPVPVLEVEPALEIPEGVDCARLMPGGARKLIHGHDQGFESLFFGQGAVVYPHQALACVPHAEIADAVDV